ncbi:hypothetical protein HKD51_02325 [Pseudomonas fragi]|nr:hypothetical protein [Pseudomonas sp. GC01]
MLTPPSSPDTPGPGVARASPLALPLVAVVGKSLGAEEVLGKFADIPPVPIDIGPLRLSVQADASRGQAVVIASLSGTQLARQFLCLTEPKLALDIALAACTAKGLITLNLQDTRGYASVNADVVATDGQASYPLRGMLYSWPATADPVVGEYRAQLTSELSTLTTVRSAVANIAQFGFYAGDTLLAFAETTQFAPIQVFPELISSGDIRIQAGAQITLSIPTQLSPGSLFLQADFSSRNTPPTRISSLVANWSLPSG